MVHTILVWIGNGLGFVFVIGMVLMWATVDKPTTLYAKRGYVYLLIASIMLASAWAAREAVLNAQNASALMPWVGIALSIIFGGFPFILTVIDYRQRFNVSSSRVNARRCSTEFLHEHVGRRVSIRLGSLSGDVLSGTLVNWDASSIVLLMEGEPPRKSTKMLIRRRALDYIEVNTEAPR